MDILTNKDLEAYLRAESHQAGLNFYDLYALPRWFYG